MRRGEETEGVRVSPREQQTVRHEEQERGHSRALRSGFPSPAGGRAGDLSEDPVSEDPLVLSVVDGGPVP